MQLCGTASGAPCLPSVAAPDRSHACVKMLTVASSCRSTSYLEVHMEFVYDLLALSREKMRLRVREAGDHGVWVEGGAAAEIVSAEQVLRACVAAAVVARDSRGVSRVGAIADVCGSREAAGDMQQQRLLAACWSAWNRPSEARLFVVTCSDFGAFKLLSV